MIASLVYLDRKAIKNYGIKDTYGLHKFIYSLFPGAKRDFLYYEMRGDARGKKILVISQKVPEIPDHIVIEIKKIPEDYFDNKMYAFQIKLNPFTKDSKTSRYIPIKGHGNLSTWFIEHQLKWGFEVEEDTLEIFDWKVEMIETRNGIIPFNSATYKGVLKVIDKELLENYFKKGIGKGKAFGFGLLQIRPI